jgi:hypothetical protein
MDVWECVLVDVQALAQYNDNLISINDDERLFEIPAYLPVVIEDRSRCNPGISVYKI